ncbi:MULTISPECIES: damage-control phosphatase ARMT1 family protein [unclassified Helicobacter]|uniref:damage-control phosphatase ARMT1 family protein n=1 Tax=unclassified Helicobacter TaxID=2593540 RepID=UPI000CF1BEB1|nr:MULTISPECIES: ARMT1-like domain-containing protein [unclassified Helicobacter]
MIASWQCRDCLLNQVKNTLSLAPQVDEKLALQKTEEIFEQYSNNPPPKIAIFIYKMIAEITGNKDIYQEIKKESMQKASEIIKSLTKDLCNSSKISLEKAVQIAALGNVIDYGSQSAFSFQNFDFSIDFAIYDFDPFVSKLSKSKSLVYLADNAGENLFDTILIQTLTTLYPKLKIFYLVRDKPIINDLTLKDISTNELCKDLKNYCEILSSGIKSPGFIYTDAPKEIKGLIDSADLIISKGMGNFECLEEYKDERLFLLFKIKCKVVSNFLKIPIGKMIFKQNIY